MVLKINSVFWIDYCPAIFLASVFMVVVTVRRSHEAQKPFDIFIISTNFLTSIMMGMAGAYFTDRGFEFLYQLPAPDGWITLGGVIGALLSYGGFNFLVNKLVGLFDRVVDLVFGRFGG